MDHFKEIYNSKAAEYHKMIEVEDVDGNILPAIEKITSLKGKRVLDLGSGTGRIPLLFREKGVKITCLDLNFPMLFEQKRQQIKVGGDWLLVQGDMRKLPFPGQYGHVVIAGWAIGHMRSWFDADWKTEMGKVLEEMHRVAVRGGELIILETMTTGSLTPIPPTPGLAEYYGWLECEWGFLQQVIQTDYQFSDLDDSVKRTEFFFGEDLSANIRRQGWIRLPEWTGIWSKNLKD